MSLIKNKQIKVDPVFAKEINDISLTRIKKGLDTEMQSVRRVTLAMTRSEHFAKLKEDLTIRPFKDE